VRGIGPHLDVSVPRKPVKGESCVSQIAVSDGRDADQSRTASAPMHRWSWSIAQMHSRDMPRFFHPDLSAIANQDRSFLRSSAASWTLV